MHSLRTRKLCGATTTRRVTQQITITTSLGFGVRVHTICGRPVLAPLGLTPHLRFLLPFRLLRLIRSFHRHPRVKEIRAIGSVQRFDPSLCVERLHSCVRVCVRAFYSVAADCRECLACGVVQYRYYVPRVHLESRQNSWLATKVRRSSP